MHSNRKTTLRRTGAIVWGFVRAYWPAALISALAAALLWWVTTFFTALLFLIVAEVASIGYWVYWDITQGKRTTIKIKGLQLKCHIMFIL